MNESEAKLDQLFCLAMSDGIVSSYDDPTSVDAFLNFMKIKADPTSLRGGERVVSQPFSEGSVEILVSFAH